MQRVSGGVGKARDKQVVIIGVIVVAVKLVARGLLSVFVSVPS
jgi:hypothetical protein